MPKDNVLSEVVTDGSMRKQFSANTCKQALSTLSTIVPAAPRHSGTVPVRAHIGFRSCVNAQTTDRLDAGPRESDGVCSLRGLDVQRILQDQFGVLRKLPSVYWWLHRLGYSCLTAIEVPPSRSGRARRVQKTSRRDSRNAGGSSDSPRGSVLRGRVPLRPEGDVDARGLAEARSRPPCGRPNIPTCG